MSARKRRRPGLPAFHGWRIAGTGAVMQGTVNALLMQAFANYSVLLHDELGWSKSMLSLAFSLTRLEAGLLGPVQGWMIDRFGPRAVMRVGVVFFWVGFLAFSRMQSPLEFFGFSLLLGAGSTLAGMVTVTTAVVNWFERRRSAAIAVTQIGVAAGGLLTPVVALALTTIGWRETAFASAWIVLIVGLPIAQTMYHHPADIGQHIDGISPEERAAEATRTGIADEAQFSFTVREALRTPAFWLISFGHASALLVVAAVTMHLSLHLTESLGYSLKEASFVGGALPLLQLVGQVIGGYLGDRLNKRLLCAACMLGHMVGLLLLAYASNVWMVLAFIPLHGLAWGIRGPLMAAIRADYFGQRAYGQILGISSAVTMLGWVGGPMVAGTLADLTGGYQLGFTIIALAAGLGSIFFLFARPPERPLRVDEPRPQDARAAA